MRWQLLVPKPPLTMLVLALLITLKANVCFATQHLSVEKIVENNTLSTGQSVKIMLKFHNPFNQKLVVQIKDENVLAGNGLDVQCLEYELPSNKEVILAYDPIQVFTPGVFNITGASVSYENPETHRQETVTSNSVVVRVVGNYSGNSMRGVTTIYRCNGVNMQSTSYTYGFATGGSSFNIQIGSNVQHLNQELNQLMQSVNKKQALGNAYPSQNPSTMVQNNQLPQNVNALKQEMQKQLQNQQVLKNQFLKNLALQEQFQKLHGKLLSQGFNISNAKLDVKTNTSGKFELVYKNSKTGETAIVKGELLNNSLNLNYLTPKREEELMNLLSKNPKFQNIKNQLLNQGFNESKPVFNLTSQGVKVSLPFYKQGLNKTLIAEVVNNSVEKVWVETTHSNVESKKWLLTGLLVLAVVACIILGWKLVNKIAKKLSKKLSRKHVNQMIAEEQKLGTFLDYKKEARAMLVKAKELFNTGKAKDAYELISQAIRFYYANKFQVNQELTNTELVQVLKSKHVKPSIVKLVKECLHVCALVEFAKLETRSKEFERIISKAERLLK
ncbi:hypothetical protein J7L02_01285 [Candidatus Woesearchaeota archaeon]|nr:hypothetical protein [Candidatus Woesearchaeota archaeon]